MTQETMASTKRVLVQNLKQPLDSKYLQTASGPRRLSHLVPLLISRVANGTDVKRTFSQGEARTTETGLYSPLREPTWGQSGNVPLKIISHDRSLRPSQFLLKN